MKPLKYADDSQDRGVTRLRVTAPRWASATVSKSLVLLAVAGLPAGTLGIAQAGIAYRDPGWDLTYNGDRADFGTLTDTLTVGTGNWVRKSKNKWDGSKPGEVDPTLNAFGAAEGDSPGGVVALSEGSTNYVRFQDTGDPTTVNPIGQDNGFVPWLDPSNRTLMFGHDIQKEHPGAMGVMTNGITLSFRARLSSTGVLDDVYPDFNDGEVEFPDLQVVTPWPANGKGYKVSDSAVSMFSFSESGPNGLTAIGFSLVLDIDTPGTAGGNNGAVIPAGVGGGNIGGGLIMNNRPGGGIFDLPGSDRALMNPPDGQGTGANLVPISDEDLLDWHEFWITIQNPDRDADYDVNVYMDGSVTPETFVVRRSNGAQTNSNEALNIGLPSGTSWAAFDLDFVSYKLGTATPQAVPEPSTLVLMMLAILLAILGGAGIAAMGHNGSMSRASNSVPKPSSFEQVSAGCSAFPDV